MLIQIINDGLRLVLKLFLADVKFFDNCNVAVTQTEENKDLWDFLNYRSVLLCCESQLSEKENALICSRDDILF